jgi:hypothetical protein
MRTIAYYLPQFYPFEENNEWWGEGFTEWTNVGKAKPLFPGHDQPRVPKDLGYYDLRLPHVRQAQANMAEYHGIDGFCYWHYWFGNGRRLLNKVFDEVIESQTPNFPLCLGWANETWTGIWHGLKDEKRVLIEQTYPGYQDIEEHFYTILPAMKDQRYIKVDGKPLFLIYKPLNLPNFDMMKTRWTQLALENGLEGIYFVAHSTDYTQKQHLISLGYDAVNLVRLADVSRKRMIIRDRLKKAVKTKLIVELATVLLKKMIKKTLLKKYENIYTYQNSIDYFTGPEDMDDDCFPTIIPNWDHSPRSGNRRLIIHKSTPKLFRKHIKNVFESLKNKPDNRKIVFLKSWNEWAEGNYMEPDIKHGSAYLQVFREEKMKIE